MLLILLFSFLTSQAHAEKAPPQCSREGYYFLGGYGSSQRGFINTQWSPSRDPHFKSVYVSCSKKATQVCKKTAGRLNVTVKSHRPQYSALVVESSEKNVISFRARKLDFMNLFPAKVMEGTKVVLYVGTATKALCQHAIEIVP